MGIQKDNLLKLNINYSSLNEMEYLSLGELGLVIAAHKFFDLSNLINNANFSIQQINKCNSEELKSYYLRYAILDYNACYDYLLQIIYFAFDFSQILIIQVLKNIKILLKIIVDYLVLKRLMEF